MENTDSEEQSLLGRAETKSVSTPLDELTAGLFLIGYTIGAGFLVQAYVFKEAGVLVACVEYIVAVGLSYVGGIVLLEVMKDRGIFDFALVAGNVLGNWGFYYVHTVIILASIGSMISYFIILGDILQTIGTTYGGSSTAWYSDLYFLDACVVFLMLPFCFVREFPDMTFLCYVTISFVAVAVMFIVIDGPLNSVRAKPINYASAEGTVMTAGYVLLAIGMNITIPKTYKRLEVSAKESFGSVIFTSQLMIGLVLFIEGLIGYLSFRASTEVNIMDNFTGTLATVFQCIVLIHLMSYIPGWIVILRHSFCEITGLADPEESITGVVLVTASILIGLGFFSAVLSEYFGTSTALSSVINVTGGIAMSGSSFLIPALLGLYSGIPLSSTYRFLCWVMIIFTALISAVVIYASVITT